MPTSDEARQQDNAIKQRIAEIRESLNSIEKMRYLLRTGKLPTRTSKEVPDETE